MNNGELKPVQSVADVREVARPLHVFKVPKSLMKETGVSSMSFVQLTLGEEKMANAASASFDKAIALVAFSLRRVDDKPVSYGDGSAEAALAKLGPRGRVLAISAYSKLHSASEDETKDFLESQVVSSG